MQRLRVIHTKEGDLKYISHLDLMRLWERALRRAGIPLSYSKGYNPRPRLSSAAPLPLGFTSSHELLDIFLSRRVSIGYFLKAARANLPEGIDVLDVDEVWVGLPSLQSLVRFCEYMVGVIFDEDELKERVYDFLSKKEFFWEYLRERERRRYDLRKFVGDIWLRGREGGLTILSMRLRHDEKGAGRPDHVLYALGIDDFEFIHRTRIILEER